MTWFKSQFDKLLMAGLLVLFCILAFFAVLWIPGAPGDKLETFFLQTAAGIGGCLLTLVTARRNIMPENIDPNTTVTQATTVTTEPPKTS